MDNKKLLDLGWLAGIVDGEGTLSLYFTVRKNGKLNNVSPQVWMGNTDFDLIERYVSVCKNIGVGCHVYKRKNKNITGIVNGKPSRKKYKPLKAVSIIGFLRVKKFLDQVGFLLTGEKKVKGELILKFINQRLSKSTNGITPPLGRMAPYNLEDILLIKEFCQHINTKHEKVIDGLLRDFTCRQETA